MAMPAPNILIKIIWLVHFALTSWAIMSGYLSGVPSYLFTQMGVLAFGFWAIVSNESVDAVLMFLATLAFSILNDIILISIYQPRANVAFENRGLPSGYVGEYRWALGMSILNLILKPVSICVLFAVYKSRSTGSEFGITIPGVTGRGESSSSQRGGGGYNAIETAQDSHPGIYGRSSNPSSPPQPYQYSPPSYEPKQAPTDFQSKA